MEISGYNRKNSSWFWPQEGSKASGMHMETFWERSELDDEAQQVKAMEVHSLVQCGRLQAQLSMLHTMAFFLNKEEKQKELFFLQTSFFSTAWKGSS